METSRQFSRDEAHMINTIISTGKSVVHSIAFSKSLKYSGFLVSESIQQCHYYDSVSYPFDQRVFYNFF